MTVQLTSECTTETRTAKDLPLRSKPWSLFRGGWWRLVKKITSFLL